MGLKNRASRTSAAMASCIAAMAFAAVAQAQISQNFDSTAVGDLPAGWSTFSTGNGIPWAVINDQSNSPSNSAFSNDIATVSSQFLVLPTITAVGPVRIDLWSRFDTEATFDGWTVEVDINGGGFNNIQPTAASPNPWTLNGYNQPAISTFWQSPIAGQPAFSGLFLTWTEHVALISATSGDQVTIRINMSSDSSIAHVGVWLDDISVTTSSNFGACCHANLGTCELNTAAPCAAAGGTFQGLGSACPGPCPAAGACCDSSSGVCTLTGVTGCTSPSVFQGEGSLCTPTNPCVGACCDATTGLCTITGPGTCSGTFQSTGTTCTVNPCPQPPPPSNDECDAALVATEGTQTGSNFFATQSTALTTVTGDPFCGQATFGTTPQYDVFWSFVPTTTTTYDVNTCGSSFDTTLAIHTACPADDSNKLACNDDSTFYEGFPECPTNGLNSRIPSVSLTAGTTYYIRVAGYAGGHGTITLNINAVVSGACCDAVTGNCSGSITGADGCPAGTTYQGDNTTCSPTNPCPQPPRPANNDCANAIGLCDGVPVSGDTTAATIDGTATCGLADVSPDVWFTYVPASDGDVLVSLCGSEYDTVVSVLDGCGGNELACNDDSTTGCGAQSTLTLAMSAGTSYLIRVAGFDGDVGLFTVTVTGGGGQGCNGSGGVCCRGATCNTTLADAGACSGSLVSGQRAGANFVSGSSCNTGNVSSSPCCYANYNKVNGVTVQDIFDFLSDWFAGSPYARVGADGAAGSLTVQSIFDFLSNWFAGGCS